MSEQEWLADRFQERRGRLRSVAYRMLGSLAEADDAVQEAWLRVTGADVGEVDNLDAWLTTVVARVSLNALRARRRRREEPAGPHVPDPVVDPAEGTHPEHEALLADSVGLALLVVLETLGPAERMAYVLHDMFDVPFAEIAPILDRTPETARQLASRARRRIRGAGPAGDPETTDLPGRQAVVDAYLAAARTGDFAALIAVLDPDVVLRADRGPVSREPVEVRGAGGVARRALAYARLGLVARPALVNGGPGVVFFKDRRPFSVAGFAVARGRIAELDILADPEQLARLDLSLVDQPRA